MPDFTCTKMQCIFPSVIAFIIAFIILFAINLLVYNKLYKYAKQRYLVEK